MTGRKVVTDSVGHDVLGRWRLVPLPEAVGLIVGEYTTADDAQRLVAQLGRLRAQGRGVLLVYADTAITRQYTAALTKSAPRFSMRVVAPAQWQSRDQGGGSAVVEAILTATEHSVIAILWPQSMHRAFATLVHRAAARRSERSASS